jgi:hypothetical protein
MADKRSLQVMNVAWGRDDGADYDHVSANISPSIDGLPFHFFHTSQVQSLADENGDTLFAAT